MLGLFLRSDLFKASSEEATPGRAAPRGAGGGGFEVPEEKAPSHKPAVEGKSPGFKGAPIHAPQGASVSALPKQHPFKQSEGRAEGISDPTMKVHPKGKRRTGAKTTGEEMERTQTPWDHPEYKCSTKGCNTHIKPPHHAEVADHELAQHLQAGGKWVGRTDDGKHVLQHPPSILSKETGGDWMPIPHGSVSAEHVQSSKCPHCHAMSKQHETLARVMGRNPDEAKTKIEEESKKLTSSEAKKSLFLLAQMKYFAKALAAEGEDFGKPASTVSEEVSHLMKEKGYPQKRAVAAALDMERRGDIQKKSLYISL